MQGEREIPEQSSAAPRFNWWEGEFDVLVLTSRSQSRPAAAGPASFRTVSRHDMHGGEPG